VDAPELLYFPTRQSVQVAAADEVAPTFPNLPAAHKEPVHEDEPEVKEECGRAC